METMGAVYTSLGLYDQAVPLLESALEKRRALYGEEHLDVASSLDRLAEVLKHRAEYDRALPMYQQALALRRKLLGDEHVDTARSVYEPPTCSARWVILRVPNRSSARRLSCGAS
jgi:tetratricopeptide (TPR) repeat protein